MAVVPPWQVRPRLVKVTLYANRDGHFFGDAINGRPVKYLLDTGATAVSMSSAPARNRD